MFSIFNPQLYRYILFDLITNCIKDKKIDFLLSVFVKNIKFI